MFEINLKSRKNGATSFCCEALKLHEGFLLLSLAAIRIGCSLVSIDGYLILKKIVQILDMQYLAYTPNICNTRYM